MPSAEIRENTLPGIRAERELIVSLKLFLPP